MADANTEEVISFNLMGSTLIDNDKNVFEELTEEEMKEVDSVVTLLEAAEGDSLKDFENTENLLRHIPVNNDELDCLAGKNNAQSTSYQTKWAICVIKGNIVFFCIKHDFLSRIFGCKQMGNPCPKCTSLTPIQANVSKFQFRASECWIHKSLVPK